MSTITVYEHPDFKGIHRTFNADVPHLADVSFNDCISSVKVEGQPWLLYEDPNYTGNVLALEEGEYSRIGINDRVTSLSLVTEDLTNPKITVYDNRNAWDDGTPKMDLTEETNLEFGSMNDKISSHRVHSGVWLLYENPNRGGRLIVARAGEVQGNYRDINFNDKVSHVYPLRPGKGSVTATILWDKKKIESERDIQIDQYVYANDTAIEQKFTATCTKEYEKYVSHTFKFSNETKLTAGASFTLFKMVSMETELSNTFTVKKGEKESFTTKEKTELSTPVTVPPRTKITVSFLCKQVNISVPVELKIAQGQANTTESGTYRCESGKDVNISVRSEVIGTF